MASAPASRATTSASMICARKSCSRPAPMARRTASSRCRRSAADQEEVAHVGAGDEQHERHRPEQDPDRPRHPAHELLLQGAHDGPVLPDQLGVAGRPAESFGQALRQRSQLPHQVGHRHAGPHPPDQRHPEPVRRDVIRTDDRGDPEGDPVAREAEVGTHHADDRPLLPTDVVGPSDHGGVAAEPALPQAVAEQRDPVLVLGHRHAAQDGRHAERGKERGGGNRHPHPLGAVAHPQGVGEVAVGCQALEQLRVFPILKEELCREVEFAGEIGPGRGTADVHQPIGLAERQRAEQHRVHDAEDPRGGAEREAERPDRDQREARRAPQSAHRLAEVLDPAAAEPPHDASSRAPRGRSQ